jgi:hypothetical protein
MVVRSVSVYMVNHRTRRERAAEHPLGHKDVFAYPSLFIRPRVPGHLYEDIPVRRNLAPSAGETLQYSSDHRIPWVSGSITSFFYIPRNPPDRIAAPSAIRQRPRLPAHYSASPRAPAAVHTFQFASGKLEPGRALP